MKHEMEEFDIKLAINYVLLTNDCKQYIYEFLT